MTAAVQERIACLRTHWCAVLGVAAAEPAQNFFELGGDSLAAMELIRRVSVGTGWELPIEALFTVGTLAELESLADEGAS
ncbi:acyl carrier protein [Actinoplanes sp. NPDC051859]|uniref:acyl carrier protein n=1 Tax=Actinoplanes sp. NPDC051859 TaxID=3363909 RepID=UPI00379F7376